MANLSKKIVIRDSTLREGLDVPGVSFSLKQRLKIAGLINTANVAEVEIVAPGRVLKDLEFARELKKQRLHIKTSGLVYASGNSWKEEIKEAAGLLDRFDILMPVSFQRRPYGRRAKINIML